MSRSNESKFGDVYGPGSHNDSYQQARDVNNSEKHVQAGLETDDDPDRDSVNNKLSRDKLMKMDSKKLLGVLKDLNHVTDMEEFSAAVNLIRQSIIQLGDKSGLSSHILQGLHAAMPRNHLEEAV